MTVCRLGSLSAAAAELNHTQSAVSGQIAGLERQLGVPLMERHARDITTVDLVDPPARGIYTITPRRDPHPCAAPLLDHLATAFTSIRSGAGQAAPLSGPVREGGPGRSRA
ncbi:LysR family transcriptional regulator [Streptomyces sp. NPDC008137]|uniref:helix-turn-helix domain-containing protein n=1 Tax=Streptomyces sp. NPDC008137 TaxID=3364813 RepID=UPI0036E426D5